jgi:RNA polymerase sigma-70 factor (ECF subfamily)
VDSDLVIQAQEGDQQAFEALAIALASRLRRIAYGVLRDMDLAEDAVQQAVIAIWKDLPRLRDPARFEAWTYRILVRLCYAQRRRISKRDAVLLRTSPDDPASTLGPPEVILRDQLERGFARLTLEHRSIVVLHHQLGLSLDEVSTALGIPVGTVKSRLHRAMGELRSALEADLRPAIQEPRPVEVRR